MSPGPRPALERTYNRSAAHPSNRAPRASVPGPPECGSGRRCHRRGRRLSRRRFRIQTGDRQRQRPSRWLSMRTSGGAWSERRQTAAPPCGGATSPMDSESAASHAQRHSRAAPSRLLLWATCSSASSLRRPCMDRSSRETVGSRSNQQPDLARRGHSVRAHEEAAVRRDCPFIPTGALLEQWRRRKSNPRPRSRARWRLRA